MITTVSQGLFIILALGQRRSTGGGDNDNID